MKSETKNWIRLAKIDYEDSLLLFKNARHPNAVYLICLAVEKALKAVRVEFVGERPRKTHELDILAGDAKLELSEQQMEHLQALTRHFKRSRYQDLGQAYYNTKHKVEPIIKSGTELYLWITEKLNNQSNNS